MIYSFEQYYTTKLQNWTSVWFSLDYNIKLKTFNKLQSSKKWRQIGPWGVEGKQSWEFFSPVVMLFWNSSVCSCMCVYKRGKYLPVPVRMAHPVCLPRLNPQRLIVIALWMEPSNPINSGGIEWLGKSVTRAESRYRFDPLGSVRCRGYDTGGGLFSVIARLVPRSESFRSF